ncbi:hypothetical protein GBF38_020297 [Nibea albiflora]|uniref:Uncharacterized protein n=1 Tax=Nibea albiflora TaxID=240163 RepID=A0ACB7FE80_NIBAL|nr:hypothetical protein GBF38_020297 [Nibea albiflora]
MLRFPVKKIRKQFKLLLLLVLLTSAVWFTYLHINQGKTIKLHFNYGKVKSTVVLGQVESQTSAFDINNQRAVHEGGLRGHRHATQTRKNIRDWGERAALHLLLRCCRG